MMTMVGCDRYDEPFNLVNNDNPDYLKISRAGCTGTMSAGGPDIQRVSRIIRGGGGTENCSVACFLAVVLLYC